ncbi:MAG: winged helix-turn-helix domain-containing protein [Nanoarchaeota archaeon]|nr:winged helix-turn-helix domain-containing protein [Nanoarchaeota archaeon]
MKHRKWGAFCETYGATIENGVLEYLLENQDLDVAVGDLAKETLVSRPKAYDIIKEFEKKGFVVKSRVVGKTQLYRLNKENVRVKIFLRNFQECLQLIVEEHAENRFAGSSPTGLGVASAKPF